MKVNKYTLIAIICFIVILAGYLYFSEHNLTSDEARDLSIARNMMRGEGQTILDTPFTQHGPMFYWLLMGGFAVFGFTDLAGIVVMAVLGALTCLVVYFLGKEIINEKVGLLSMGLLATFPGFWILSERILNHVPELLFSLLALLFFIRWEKKEKTTDALICGLFIAFAILTRVSALTLLFAIAIYLTITTRHKWLFYLDVVVMALPIGISVIYLILTDTLKIDFVSQTLGPTSTLNFQPWHWYITSIIPLWLIPVTIVAGVIGIYILLKTFKDTNKNILLLLIWAVVFFAFIAYWPVKTWRYIINIVPVVILIGCVIIERIKWRKLVYFGIIAMMCLFTFVSITMLNDMSQENAGLKDCASYLVGGIDPRIHVADNELVLSTSIMQTIWYTDLDGQVFFPRPTTSKEEILMLINDYNLEFIVVDQWETLPPYLSLMDEYPNAFVLIYKDSYIYEGVNKSNCAVFGVAEQYLNTSNAELNRGMGV